MTNVTDETLGKIARQQSDLFRRVREGSLDPTAVSRGLQDIIDGKFAPMTWNPPIWWRTPEQQLERAHQLWPNAVLPEPPKEFTPRTKSEVLLLHVPDTFESLWDKVEPPKGYAKYCWEEVRADKCHLRLAPNKVEYTTPVWLAFDPEHGRGVRPDSFWDRDDIAASEVFSALIQFLGWPLSWLNDASIPNLAGYQLNIKGNWSNVPYPFLRVEPYQLDLCGASANSQEEHWSSPSVREC